MDLQRLTRPGPSKPPSPRRTGWVVGLCVAGFIALGTLGTAMDATSYETSNAEQTQLWALIYLIASPFVGAIAGYIANRISRRRRSRANFEAGPSS